MRQAHERDDRRISGEISDEFEMQLKQLRPCAIAIDPMRIGFEAGRASMRFRLGCWRAAGCIAMTFGVVSVFLNRTVNHSLPQSARQISMISSTATKAAPAAPKIELAGLFRRQSAPKFDNPYLGLRASVLESGL